jgi:RNA polymerase sigma factor (sigma-70 family)
MSEIKLFQDNEKVLLQIKSGDQKILEKLYHENRDSFLAWSYQRFPHLSEDSILEVFQKAFMVMYFNIKNGKLDSLSSSFRTYLFSIAKNVYKEEYRTQKDRFESIDDNISVIETGVDNTIMDSFDKSYEKELVRQLLVKIGNPCKTLLELMYIQGYSADAIVSEMGYSDERVVRKRKFLCIQQLRELMRNQKELL